MAILERSREDAAWLEAGAGWPLLLLHAFPLHAGMWRPQLERVPPGWRFIAPELRGFGRSATGAPDASIDTYADDICRLMDLLEIESAAIAGISLGGYVALAMYRQAPNRFSGLILADTRAEADTAHGRTQRVQMRERLAEGGTAAVADVMIPRLLAHPDGPAATDVRAIIESNTVAGVDAAVAAMMTRADSRDLLPHITCASLVIVGRDDVLTPPDDARAMAEAIPRATLVEIPGAGHLSNLEQPDLFSRAVADFLTARS